jgi:2-oxo-4-hydroxy-4-carboxy-5-ureidoimidazoline decarboxylase
VNRVLKDWNRLSSEEAQSAILPCCGSSAWARRMAARRPLADVATLLSASDQTWEKLAEADWMEAFRSHPRIGESQAQQRVSPQSAAWSSREQQAVNNTGDTIKIALRQANRKYERRFGRIFIVCATGKSAKEILEILGRRLQNDPATELQEAAEQQRQITRMRLRKWLRE